MEDAAEEGVSPQEKPVPRSRVGWKVLWFGLHLAAVYVIVKFCTPWLAGWTRGTLLPLLQLPVTSKRSEFLVSHLFALSFVPAFLAGFINARFRQKAAQFACLVPAAILAYKFATFPAPSAFQSQFAAAVYQYFGGGFVIPELGDWRDLSRADIDTITRGMAQLGTTHRSCIEGSKRDN